MKKDSVTTEIVVKENKIGILRVGNVNYISLTDLAKQANPEDPSGVIRNWMSNKNSFDLFRRSWKVGLDSARNHHQRRVESKFCRDTS